MYNGKQGEQPFTVLAWTEQVNCRELREQPNDIRVVTKSCNVKNIIRIIWIKQYHYGTAIYKLLVLHVHNLSFCSGLQHLVS